MSLIYPYDMDDLLDIRCIRFDSELDLMDEDPVREEEETLTESAIRAYEEEGGY